MKKVFVSLLLCIMMVGLVSALTNVTNETWVENLTDGETINVEENANLTFTSTEDSGNWFDWIVSGVSRLAGFGENIFNWVFNLKSDNPNADVNLLVGGNYQIDSFNDSTTEKNLTFTGNENQTAYVSIDRYSNVTSGTFNLTGFNSTTYPTNPYLEIGTPDGSYEWKPDTPCYQETANVSTSCGGLSTGSYYVDWGECVYTGAHTGEHFKVNYTIPVGVTSAIWEAKYGDIHENITVPSGCLDNGKVQFYFDSYTGGITDGWNQPKCFNYSSTSWISIGTLSNTSNTGNGDFNSACFPAEYRIDGDWDTYNGMAGASGGGRWTHIIIGSYSAARIYEEAIIWGMPTTFNASETTSDLSSSLNTALDGGSCTGGTLNGDDCVIPFLFHSDTAGIIGLDALSILYDGDYIINETYEIETSSANPLIQIIYPANGSTITQDNITQMNYTFYDETDSTCWYNINSGTNNTITCGTNVTNININTTGTYTIKLYANDSLGNMNSSTSTFYFNGNPKIVVNYPTETVDYGTTGLIQLNITVTDSNLDKVWYNYNGTNVTIEGCVSGVKNSTTFTLENDKNITIWANDTVGNIVGTFYSWAYRVFATSETYSETAVETSLQNFVINISYNSSNWNSITAKLNYAGTNYTGIQTGTGDTISFSKEIAIGTISAEINNSFYWIFSLTNATASYPVLSNSHNQTASVISFGLCAPTDHPYINFTTYDATNPFPLVNATFKSSWDITDVSGGSVILNRSFEDTTGTNSSWAFCISPNSTNYTISVDIETDGATLAKNYYYLTNATVTNVSTTNVTIYLINDSEATLTELSVVDSNSYPIEDVIITIQSYDVGTDTFYTVAMAKTSSNGKDLVYLNWYDTFYKFIFVKDGETLYSTSPYKISETPQIFKVVSETAFVFEKFRDFQYSLTYNNETQNFVLTFVKPSGDVDAGCLRVYKRNITNDYTICETCEVSSSATIYCNIADWGNGTFIADFYATGSFKWIANLFETIGDINSAVYDGLGNVGATGIAIIFAGVVTSFFLISPVLGVVGVLLGSFGAMFLGFQQIDYTIFWSLAILGGLVIWKLQK